MCQSKHDDTREMLRLLGEAWDFRVEACNGLEAVEAALREKPQVILMDTNTRGLHSILHDGYLAPLCRISVLPHEIKRQNDDRGHQQEMNQASGYKATIKSNQPEQ